MYSSCNIIQYYVFISRQLHMATYLRQLYYLLYKNVIFKRRHKPQAIAEVLIVLLFPALFAIIWKKYLQHTSNAIPSSKQIIHNASEIPGGKRKYLAYVTNVNASEFQVFFSFTL